MLRAFFVSLSENRRFCAWLQGLAIGKRLSHRFVAGETLEELGAAIEELNHRGIHVTADYLGESVLTQEEALHNRDVCHQILDLIDKRKLKANLSVKLTSIGLDVDAKLCAASLAELCAHACLIDSFVRVDMEGSAYTQRTLDMTLAEHQSLEDFNRVGVVLQSYMLRTYEDIKDVGLAKMRVRLCKGAYLEAADVAFQEKRLVDENYLRCAFVLLSNGCYNAFATHDAAIIEEIKKKAIERNLPKSAFEFQMLHGVRRDLQEKLSADGYSVRVYVPFGTAWCAYFLRRIGERPANLFFILKNLFRH